MRNNNIRNKALTDKGFSSKTNAISSVMSFVLLSLIIIYLFAIFISIIRLENTPAEVRDAAVLQTTNLLAMGINPYAPSPPPPPVLLDSGFLNILPAVLLIRLFNLPVVFATYFVNYIYLVLGVVIFFLTALSLSQNKLLSLTGAFLILFCFDRCSALVVRPDFLAGVFLIAILYIVVHTNQKQSAWNWQLHVCALFCVIILYLKIHYAVVALSLALFFMSVNKKHALIFVVSGLAMFAVSLVVLQMLYPTHLPVWFARCLEMFSQNGVGKYIANSSVPKKMLRLFKQFLPAMLLCCVGIVSLLIKYKARIFKHITGKDERTLCFLIVNGLVNGLTLLFVGGWSGADLWYFYFMLMPSVILLAIYFIKSDILTKTSPYAVTALFAALCIISSVSLYKKGIETVLMTVDNRNYTKAYKLLDQHKSDEMFLTMHLSTYSIINNIYNYDYGDACYLPRIKFNSSVLNKVFTYSTATKNRHIQYQYEIIEKIDNKDYTIVAVSRFIPFVEEELSEMFYQKLSENYIIIDTIPIHVTRQQFDIATEFWIPKT